MLRFVDLSAAYWPDSISAEENPCCGFVDTVTDRFVEHDGSHVLDSEEEVREAVGNRGLGLLPKGFFSRPAGSPST
jgi:hypothetical protein